MSGCEEFDNFEDVFQRKYDNIKLPFDPNTIVEIDLLDFRGISVGRSDWVDTPDPQFRLLCPAIKRPHLRKFQTKTIGENMTSGFVGETFRFIIPNDHPEKASFPIEIELYDIDYGPNDFIGKETVETSALPDDGSVFSATLKFGNKNGELDIKINKTRKQKPDFRYSLGLCPEEKAFRKKRLPIVFEAMKKALAAKGPKSVLETPIVSLVASGGGYRAVVGMCGAMEALKDAGLLDIFTYSCGLSGSSWYLGCSYIFQGMKESELENYHLTIRDRFQYNLVIDMINPLTYGNYVSDSLAMKHDMPTTFVNYFPGYLVGKQILNEKMDKKLSDMIPYVESAEVPYPLLVALHVKNKLRASQYHAYVERTPYEISIPSYGINVRPEQECSTWQAGHIVREVPELSVHFTLGMTGCAFSILLNSFLTHGGELSKKFSAFVEKKRLEGKKQVGKSLDETNRVADIESEDEEDDDDDVVETTIEHLNESDLPSHSEIDGTHDNCAEQTENEDIGYIRKIMRSIPFFSSRNAVVGRTARLFNVALDLANVKRHFLNPFTCKQTIETGKAAEVIKACGMEHVKDEIISTKKNVLSYADAGVLKNVPTDMVLRPQRRTELMIVMDFNAYDSDDDFDYEPLLAAAAHAWQSGLEFPEIDFTEITNMPPKELIILPSDGPNCPTVLWFTLCNKQFKNLKDYTPRSDASPPAGDHKKFNDFNVFGENTPFSTFTFQYSNYNFDQLRELMYYNVFSHREEIKEALHKTILKKRNKQLLIAGEIDHTESHDLMS